MTSFIYNSPEILGLIKKSQDMKSLPSGWDKDNFNKFKSFLDELEKAKTLFAIPLTSISYSEFIKNKDQSDLDQKTLKQFDELLAKLTNEARKQYDQTSIAKLLNELTEMHNLRVVSKFDGWLKSNPQLLQNFKNKDAEFIHTLSGLKGLAGFTQTKSLSESYSNQLEQLIESLHQKYNEVNNGRDITGALSAFFNGKVPEKDKALKNINDIISKLSDLNIYIKSGDYQSTNSSINAINMFLTANTGLFNNNLVNQINSITSNIKADATRNSEASKTISKEVSDVVTALLDRLSNQSAADLNPKSNVTGNDSPKLKDIDDGFSYIKYLYDNQFKVNGELIVKPLETSIIDNKNGWRVIDLSDKVPGGGIVQFNVNLLKAALLDIQRQARTSQDKLFIDLVGHLALDCQYLFSVNANIGKDEIDANMVLDSVPNPLKDFNDLTSPGPKKIIVADLKDQKSFDNWLSGLTYTPTNPDDKTPNNKPDSCVTLNYLYKRASKKDRLISKPYIELLTAIMQSTSCAIDSSNTGGKGKGQGEGANNEGSASQNQTGSRSPAEANEARLQAANLGNVAATSLPFQDKNVSIIRYINFAKSIKDFSVYLAKEHLSTNNKDVSYNYASVAQNAEALYQEINQFKSTYIQLNNFTIASGNELKTSLNIATENARLSIAAANGLLDLFTKTKNLISAFGEMVNLETKPGLKSAIDEQYSFYTQHIRAISDATTLLKEQMRSIRQ